MSKMEMAATVRTELALSGLFRVVSILEENFRDVKTSEEMRPLNDFVGYKFEALIREAKSDDLVQLMPVLEKLQAAALELEDLLDFYEYDQIEKQVSSSSSSEHISEEKVLPTHLRNGLDKLLMIVEQLENKRQSVTSKTGSTQPQADTVTSTMEMAAKEATELALSGLFRVVSMLEENFRDVKTTGEMKALNDFTECKIEALIGEAKSDDLVQLMPLLEELQAAALEMEDQLDLYEYEQIEKQVNSYSSDDEAIPKEKVLPTHLRDGLNKLLMIVERVETIRQSITTSNSFIDFLVGEFHVARPVIKLAVSDISHLIKMLGSNLEPNMGYSQLILEQLKDVVNYHVQALMEYVNSNDLARSMQLLDILKAASLHLDQFNPYESASFKINNHSYLRGSRDIGMALEKFKTNHSKSPLRIGLEILLKYIEGVEKIHPSSSKSGKGTTQPQVNTITPTLRIGVERWLKFVGQVEKERPFITSNEDPTHPDYTFTPISTTFFHGCLSAIGLENSKCQEDAEEIMQNHKNNLKKLVLGWTNIASSTGTCKEVLERLEPYQNLANLSLIGYSCSKFPNWMEKENWLSRLQKLTLQSCTSLEIVRFLPPCLESLYVENCHKLMQLPLVSDTLRSVKLFCCSKLTTLGNLQRCTSLESLNILFCPKLKYTYGKHGPLRSTISHVGEVSIH